MPKWIKASEQLPTEWAKVHWRMTGNKQPITSGLAHSYLYGKSEYNYDSIEWLDESVQEGWVDVRERLPENMKPVIIVCYRNDSQVVDFAYRKCGVWKDIISRWSYICPITHWRPLPAPPSSPVK